jgi:hypothetical protein
LLGGTLQEAVLSGSNRDKALQHLSVPLLYLPHAAWLLPRMSFRFGGATFMCFKDLTLVPIQTKMINPDLLTQQDEEWIDNYHKQVSGHNGFLTVKRKCCAVQNWLLSHSMLLEYCTRCLLCRQPAQAHALRSDMTIKLVRGGQIDAVMSRAVLS